MKSILTFLAIAAALSLTGCSLLTKYGYIEYNNLIVEDVKNLISPAIEESIQAYDAAIPDFVTEEETIDSAAMETSYDTAKSAVNEIGGLTSLKSKDAEQEAAVRAALTVYKSASEMYLEVYEKMLDYYASKAYLEDISMVNGFDEDLHQNYTIFQEAHNDLVETLKSFVETKEE